jgi:flagellum-specific peptidoglycan hydrolase FlgJ
MTRTQFVGVVAPIAQKLWEEGSTYIFPSIRIAQTLLETGGVIHDWNNLVGYKVGSGTLTKYWKGRSVSTSTWEVYEGVTHTNVKANWRAYDSIEYCFRDQDLLFLNDRYKAVREATTPEDQAVSLYRCGYATDPEYYRKLIEISKPYKFLDVHRGKPKKGGRKMELTQNQWKMLADALNDLYKKSVNGGLAHPVFSDYTWCEKAYKMELTLDECLWLQLIMFTRSQGVQV